MTQRRMCSGCEYDGLVPFLDLGLSPIADAYTATPEELSPTYPLQVAVCMGCRLVQLLEVVDAETLFGTGYSFYSGASAPLSEYHEHYARDVLRECRDLTSCGVVEIGCNDGDMLRWFATRGLRHVGVDPAEGPAKVAQDRGLNVLVEPFSHDVAQRVVDADGHAGVVIANHVLAHVEDVSDVMHGVATVLAADGVAYVEVQYVQDLLVNNAFDLVYHEHRNFFSLTSLERAARRWGLHVVDAKLTPRQGGSLRVRLMHDRRSEHPRVRTVRDSEWWLNSGMGAYDGVQGRVERVRQRLWDVLEPILRTDETIAGHGAPAKATTLLNFCEIDSSTLDYVVDTTPAKQGRFIPGTRIPIYAPADVDVAPTQLILAWNYAREIIRSHRAHDVRWIIPVPAPVVI